MTNTLTLMTALHATIGWARARFASTAVLGAFAHRVFIALDALVRHTLAATDALAHWLSAATAGPDPEPVPAPVPRAPRLPRAHLAALLLGLTCLGLTPLSAAAWNGSGFEFTADGRLVDVQVVVDGSPAPLYLAPGRFDRRYFQAFRGRNYSLVVRNNTGVRVGVLISVDGINVISGQRSALSGNESMYVLDPYESATIRGWRTSLNDVRRFVFVDEQRSYAERTGQANGDLGWIRVLSFRERSAPRPNDNHPQVREDRSSDERDELYGAQPKSGSEGGISDTPAPRAQNAPVPEEGSPESGERVRRPAGESKSKLESERQGAPSSPGTGWGEQRWDPVRETWFVAERRATDRIVLRYEYAAGLHALGIEPWYGRDRLWERERGQLGFAEPPRW